MARPLEINPLNYVVNRQYRDTLVIKKKLFRERLRYAKNLFRGDLLAHYGCVNAIEFSNEGDLLVSGGDDRRVLVWFIPDAIFGRRTPVAMQTNHTSNIFCLAFDKFNTKIFSGGNDDQVIVHDMKTGGMILKLPHRSPVYGLSINPQNDNILATAGDDGRLLLFDIRTLVPEGVCLAKQNTGFHSVVFHPTNPRLLVSAHADQGIALWDCRKVKKELIHYDPLAGKVSGISACFNSSGSHVLALRRRLPPVLYATQDPNAICQFYHPQYYNSCTMKTCCFAGDEDEYVLSGSDDFNLYMWSIPQNEREWGKSHIVLHGHRSIVNQVRYNKNNNLIASSGVEKMVKLWSTLPVGKWSGSLLNDYSDPQRIIYSKDEYNSIVGPQNSQRISHDYSDQSTQEDLRMMAFFDSLIQTEIQNWNSMSEDTFTSDSDSDKQAQEKIRLSWKSLLKCKKSAEESLKKHKPNKIAQLIAQKRNKLAKMAHWKSSVVVQRCRTREERRKETSNHKLKNSSRPLSNHKYRKNNGVSSKNVSKRVTRSCPPSGLTDAAKRKQLHRHHHNQHSHTKNNEQQALKSRSETSVQRTYRTRSQTLREDRSNATDGATYDVPSTSTGITGTANVYRVIEQDSDEDATPSNGDLCNNSENGGAEGDNFVDIIPTPLNGSHDMYINVLEMSSNGNNINDSDVNSVGNNNINNNNNIDLDCDVSTSSANNSPRSVKCEVSDDDDEEWKGDFASSYSDSERECNYTPVKRRRLDLSEIDSGFATGSSNSYAKRGLRSGSSSTTYATRSVPIAHSSDDEYQYEKFRKRIKKARVNIRKQVGGDSDSN